MKTDFENLTEQEKELIRYWIEKYYLQIHQNMLPPSYNEFIEKNNLSPKPKIEVGKWYTGLDHILGANFIGYITEIKDGRFFYYGFNCCGDWKDKDYYSNFKSIREAAKEEVEERLIQEFNKKYLNFGVKCLHYADNCTDISKIERLYYDENDNCLRYDLPNGVGCAFDSGKWAEIIDEKAEIKETIARLQKEIETLKKQLE